MEVAFMSVIFGRGYKNSDKPTNEPFYVNNCGFYIKENRDILTNRPNGRSDYEFIYVMEGHLEILIDSKWERAEKGDLVIFEPYKKQHTFYNGSKEVISFCYLHFTGEKIHEAIKNMDLKTGVYHIGPFDEYINRCYEMTDEMRKKDKMAEMKISALALLNISAVYEKISKKKQNFSDVIVKMQDDSVNGTKMEDYAAMHNISLGYFIKQFKKEYGLTPTNYRIKLLIDKSKILLKETDLKISEVAKYCGFDDSFYFSKTFKNKVGTSPEKYRKGYKA